MDALSDMLTDLRKTQPTGISLTEFEDWLDSIIQVIAAYPTELRRDAAILLVTNDLMHSTNVTEAHCITCLSEAVDAKRMVRS